MQIQSPPEVLSIQPFKILLNLGAVAAGSDFWPSSDTVGKRLTFPSGKPIYAIL